jgi:hypothetical protein
MGESFCGVFELAGIDDNLIAYTSVRTIDNNSSLALSTSQDSYFIVFLFFLFDVRGR